MSKGVANKRYTAEFKVMVVETMRKEGLSHKEAKAVFDELSVKKLPTVKTLPSRICRLAFREKKAYGQYHSAKKEMQDILTDKANIDRLLGLEQEHQKRERTDKMMTFEKILEVFEDYLNQDDVFEVVTTKRGYTVMI